MRVCHRSSWSRAALLAAILLLVGVHGTRAQRSTPAPVVADRELTVANHGHSTVAELYVSPSNLDQWGNDKLGDDTLEPGKTFKVRLGRIRDCEFDVQVVYEDGSHEESRRINVCRTRQIAFDGAAAVPAPHVAKGEEHVLTLFNHAGRPIQQVFISPADASQWGDDRLAAGSLSTGDSAKLTYHGDCTADMRIVFDNKAAEERRALNLCETATLSIEPGWTTADTPPTGATTAPAQSSLALAAPPVVATGTVTTPPAKSTVDVINRSGHPAVELYLFPNGAADRGHDLLGANELMDGGTIAISFDRSGSCKFTVHIVYGGKTPDGEQHDLDLCSSQPVVLQP